MLFKKIPIALLISLFHSNLKAQDGGQLYALYCAACHAPDGSGANVGAFPQLAGSDWITGNPERTISIVLKGLEGPIKVSGKPYNLAMPAQGDALSDDQIAAILTYVHSSWGNKGEKVSPEKVRETRAKHQAQTSMWKSEEILKLYPLQRQKSAITNLISYVYKGPWNGAPDFSKIEPENVEEEHHGLLGTDLTHLKEKFGIVWEGEFIAPKDGEYEFNLDSDDTSRLLFGDKLVAEVKGYGPLGRRVLGKTLLKAGLNPIRIEYVQNGGKHGITLGWRLVGDSVWNWVSKKTPPPEAPSILLASTPTRTAIYRNFIEGSTARGIGVGFPNGLNIVYSADLLAPALIWTGKFIDAGRHWTERGQGFQKPAGEKVTKLVSDQFLPAEARFLGYQLDPAGNPSFRIKLHDQILTDTWKPGKNGTLDRILQLSGGTKPLEVPLGDAPSVTPLSTISLSPGKTVTVSYSLK